MKNARERHRCAIVWMRRALRVDDNQALLRAAQEADEVIPVLCLSPDARYRVDSPRRRFVNGCIMALDEELRRRGSRLFVVVGSAEDALPRLARQVGATLVTAVRVADPLSRQRDARLAKRLNRQGAELILVHDRTLLEGRDVLNGTGAPFRVFTPYKRAWFLNSMKIQPPFDVKWRLKTPSKLAGTLSLAEAPNFLRITSDDTGEHAAFRRLKWFLRRSAVHYHRQRDIPAVDGTSRLSSALAVGAISIRRVFDAVIRARADVPPNERTGYDAFINELIWREFFSSILEHFPHAADGPLREQATELRWSEDRRHFARWTEGTTGFPIVDAGMRQLAQEGWMHNRVRMIVASFLVKDLRINWQWGERHFLDSLCDADIASNNGGWQWAAGTGTDAAPWFRIFNPALQGKRFDPEGAYVRRYVPELRNVPARYIHAPETMPHALQKDVGCILGRDYPAPIVNHAEAAQEFRQWFQHRPISKRI